MAGVCGHLLSSAFIETVLPTLPGTEAPPADVLRELEAWSVRRDTLLGPAASVRSIADTAIVPLLKLLGYSIERRFDEPRRIRLSAGTSARGTLPVIVACWTESLERTWRDAVVEGVRSDARWCICSNGHALRMVDGHRTWSRRHLEFDLALVVDDPVARHTLWNLARADAMSCDPPTLTQAAELSSRQNAAVCRALGDGMLEALELLMAALALKGRHSPAALLDQSLTVLYRILFLLFAEARGLVPMWNPLYRERYTIDSIVTTLLAGRQCRGIWQAILAISRLAHAGCSAGELKVTAFNGRLFAPSQSLTFDHQRIDDRTLARAIMAVGATGGSSERSRISYKDLDVEQIGAVYERLLDYEPVSRPAPSLARSGHTRRSTGSFYTPRAVTAFLVRQTLEPLVRERTADDILRLRILDPAMGSGAFLVEACRFLATVVEDRLVAEGRWHEGDAGPGERMALRREIAQRCLYGVDLNPMAVQLARLSLWLTSLAADKPLTFLDHHLVTGNSLIGATLADLWRQPTRTQRRLERPRSTPLFGDADLTPVLQHAMRTRMTLAVEPDDTPAIVHAKEQRLTALHEPLSPLGRWTSVLDLWCAGWFWDRSTPPGSALFKEMGDRLLGLATVLQARSTDHLLEQSASIAQRHRFLHWQLAFPEVFVDERGEPRADAGFDAIVGNPPWDMVRGDSGGQEQRAAHRLEARQLTDFARESGVYRVEAGAHVNRYQLFVERALQLSRPGGRLGLVLPSGLLADAGTARLRRHLLDRAEVDAVTGLTNRAGIFPIHRGLRFVLLTATTGRPTRSISCRFGLTRTDVLDDSDVHRPLVVMRSLLETISGPDDLGIPELATEQDVRILEKINSRVHWLGSPEGWNVHFGRELNATDDRGAFSRRSGNAEARPVLEGKQIKPFRAATQSCNLEWRDDRGGRRIPRRARLAYRDIASATNRLTLIAAIVPARAVTTHTLFCLKTPLELDSQHVLCALLNSFVANYLIRLRVNTHVTASLISRLPVPLVRPGDKAFGTLWSLSCALTSSRDPIDGMPEYSLLQSEVAHLYGLSGDDLAHVLSTFPLVSDAVKEQTLSRFRMNRRPRTVG